MLKISSMDNIKSIKIGVKFSTNNKSTRIHNIKSYTNTDVKFDINGDWRVTHQI